MFYSSASSSSILFLRHFFPAIFRVLVFVFYFPTVEEQYTNRWLQHHITMIQRMPVAEYSYKDATGISRPSFSMQ